MSAGKKTGEAAKEQNTLAKMIDDGATQVRSTAKWIVAGFGTLGVALLGGASLADLATLSVAGQNDAAWGLSLAMAGVGFVVVPTALLLAPNLTSFFKLATGPSAQEKKDVKRLENEFVQFLDGYESVEALQSALADNAQTRSDAMQKIGKLDVSTASREAIAKSNSTVASIDTETRQLVQTRQAITDIASYLALQRRFRFALVCGVLGVALVTFGAIKYTSAETADQLAANQAALSPLVDAGQEPVPVTLRFNEDVRARYTTVLGDECELSSVLALVLSRDDDSRRVLVLPQQGCKTREIHLPDASAIAAAVGVACDIASSSGDLTC